MSATKVYDAVQDLLPGIRERAVATEQARRVPAESIAELTAAGVFRLHYAYADILLGLGREDEAREWFALKFGRAPSGPHEMALDARTVRAAGYQLGDRVGVVLRDGRRTFTLVGIVGFGETDSLLGATLAAFDLPTAQAVLGKEGVVFIADDAKPVVM